MKKFLCILMVVLMLCATLVACNDEIPDDPASQTPNEESEEYVLFSNLPEVNFADGNTPYEFNILTIGDWSGAYKSVEVVPHELAPELLQDAVLERNALVEQRFGVKITETRTTSSAGMLQDIRSNASAGTDLYDAVMPYMTEAATLAAEGLFYDLLAEDAVAFDGSWWDQSAMETLSIDNKLYFITGDLCLLAYDCTHCLVFNRDLATENGVDPYQLVYDGEWTLDKMLEISKGITREENNDGTMDLDDVWGCLINSNFTTSMFLASGERLTTKDENDMPVIAVMGTRQIEVFDKIYNLCSNDAVGHIDSSVNIGRFSSVWTAASTAIAEKRALFRAIAMVDIFEIAEFECSFGLLPTPKASEDQENYYSNVSAIAATCVAIPKTNKNYECAAVVMDAMAQASTNTVRSSYYDNLLKLRKLQGEDDEKMLDIIFAGRVYDYGILFQWGGINTFMNDIAFSGTNNFKSKYDSIEGSIESAIENTIEGMR